MISPVMMGIHLMSILCTFLCASPLPMGFGVALTLILHGAAAWILQSGLPRTVVEVDTDSDLGPPFVS